MAQTEDISAQVLDYLYGLLDEAEMDAFQARLMIDPRLQVALEDGRKAQGLLRQAARLPIVLPPFVAPTEAVTTPAVSPVRKTRPAFIPWVVAASVLLAIVSLLSAPLRDQLALRQQLPIVEVQYSELAKVSEQQDALRQKMLASEADYLTAQKQYDSAVKEWVLAERNTVKPAPGYQLSVRGPRTVSPNSGGTFEAFTTEGETRVSATITAELRTAKGDWTRPLTVRRSGDSTTIRVPNSVWAKSLPADPILLHISADRNGAMATLQEPIALAGPVWRTFLTSDKPIYHIGDMIELRSLTLERTTQLPPPADYALTFALLKPDGKPLAGLSQTGTLVPHREGASPSKLEPILGPDGHQVRGVGCAAMQLPKDLPGGEYTLTATDEGGTVVARRAILVREHTPEHWQKTLTFDAASYAPGAIVRATLQVMDQAKPAANQFIRPQLRLDADTNTTLDYEPTTDAMGRVVIQFTMPNRPIRQATLAVQVAGPPAETLLRPVPLTSDAVQLEFFPEGGDLIANVPNRVYFRATNPDGKPAHVAGFVMDGARRVAAVQTSSDPDQPHLNRGTGQFEFTPKSGVRYTVELQTPATVSMPIDAGLAAIAGVAPARGFVLPKAKTEGVLLHIPLSRPNATGLSVRLKNLGKARELLVTATIRGQSVGQQRIPLTGGQTADVPLELQKSLGSVVRVTVYEVPTQAIGDSIDYRPMAERLVYRASSSQLKLSYTTDKPDYLPGDMVEMK
ncbi:MAG: hypothetical protein ACRCZF_24320, partial [Gemmataceae bacterium]